MVWTGTELVIVNHLSEGTVFDPATGEQTPIATSQQRDPLPRRRGWDAVFVGDRWLDSPAASGTMRLAVSRAVPGVPGDVGGRRPCLRLGRRRLWPGGELPQAWSIQVRDSIWTPGS